MPRMRSDAAHRTHRRLAVFRPGGAVRDLRARRSTDGRTVVRLLRALSAALRGGARVHPAAQREGLRPGLTSVSRCGSEAEAVVDREPWRVTARAIAAPI